MIDARRLKQRSDSSKLGAFLLLTALVTSGAVADEPAKLEAGALPSRRQIETKLLRNLRGHTRWVRSLAFAPSGHSLISSSDDGSVLLWKLDDIDQADVVAPTLLRRYESPVTAVALAPSGKHLAVGTWDGLLEICDLKGEPNANSLEGHNETVTSLDFHPTGKYLASGSADDTLVLWDIATGEELLSFHQGNEYDVTTVAFDPSGKRAATGDGENQLKVWDAETGDEIATLRGHTETVTCAEFSPDGKSIVSGGWDDSLLLWAAKSGRRVKELRGHSDDITDVLFVDGDLIVSASEDKTVRIWSAQTAAELATLKLPDVPYAIAYNTHRHLLAVGGRRDCRIFLLSDRL